MRKQHPLIPPVLGLALGLGAVSAAQAGMTTYTCRFDPAIQAGLVINYDTATGHFGLIDYYGTPSLPGNMQVEAFNADGALLGFTLNAFTDGTLTEASTYRFDFVNGQASMVRYTMQNAPVTFAGSCMIGAEQAGAPVAPATTPAAAPPPVSPQPITPQPITPQPTSPPPAAPPAIAAADVRTSNSYHCVYDDRSQVGLAFDFSPETGAFALTDFYGSSELITYPEGGFGSQLGAVSLEGTRLEFTIENTSGTEVIGGDTYVFDTHSLATTDTGFEINDDGHRVDLEQQSGRCSQIAKSGQNANQALEDAIKQAAQSPAPFYSFTPQARTNTICARDDRPTDFYSAVTWCVSSAGRPDNGASFGPESLMDPTAAWCTSDGGWGMNDTVEISFEGLAAGSFIRAIALVNGASLESGAYYSHSRPEAISVEGEGGGFRWDTLEDLPTYQAISFSQPLYSDWVRLKISDVVPAINANHNACISGIVVDFGH